MAFSIYDATSTQEQPCPALLVPWATLVYLCEARISDILKRPVSGSVEQSDGRNADKCWAFLLDVPLTKEELHAIFKEVDASMTEVDSSETGVYPVKEIGEPILRLLVEHALPFYPEKSLPVHDGVWFFSVPGEDSVYRAAFIGEDGTRLGLLTIRCQKSINRDAIHRALDMILRKHGDGKETTRQARLEEAIAEFRHGLRAKVSFEPLDAACTFQ